MNTLLDSLYNLLSFITEDAIANKFPGTEHLSPELKEAMDKLMSEIEKKIH